MIKGINFQPWISEKYEKGTGKYGRLLVLGESHYYEEDSEEEQKDDMIDSDPKCEIVDLENNLTSAVVQEFIDKKHSIPFFRNLGLLFNANDKQEIWNEIAFANGIQVALNSSTAQPTVDEIDTIKSAFWLLLDNLSPDKILVCSKRMWNYWLPEDNLRAKHLMNISENNKHSNIWQYKIGNKNCLAMGINHPSKYFSYENWKPIVMNFLTNKYIQ